MKVSEFIYLLSQQEQEAELRYITMDNTDVPITNVCIYPDKENNTVKFYLKSRGNEII